MKKSVFPVLVAAVLSVFLVTVVMAAESGKMETATGKVTSIDPQGKGITITEMIGGKEAMDVGTVVDRDTVVKVKGKEATLKDIKVGDTVTIRFLRSTDLYAKEIIKE